jgi:hypothetical protein
VAVALAWLLLVRTHPPGAVPASLLASARAAGCGSIEHPAAQAPAGLHLAPGAPYEYPDEPAASGFHDPSPLPPEPHVYREPVPETRAVHNLEHAYVVLYYRPPADGGLSAEAVRALEGYASDQARVILAPFDPLPEGVAFAMLAWNTRWECPAVTPDQALAFAGAFVDAYRGTTIAPEAPRGLLGPWLTP